MTRKKKQNKSRRPHTRYSLGTGIITNVGIKGRFVRFNEIIFPTFQEKQELERKQMF